MDGWWRGGGSSVAGRRGDSGRPAKEQWQAENRAGKDASLQCSLQSDLLDVCEASPACKRRGQPVRHRVGHAAAGHPDSLEERAAPKRWSTLPTPP